MFSWLTPSATVKSVVELKHSNGETLKITIEGSNINQVNYVSNRIKETFKLKSESKFPQKEFDDIWTETEAIWKESEKIWKEARELFKK